MSSITPPSTEPVAGPSLQPPNRFDPPKLPKKPENPFVYLGIPQWVFDWRPKPPSRNMSIFLSVTVGVTAAFIYDRRECKRIQQEYIDKVKFMSEEKLDTTEMARRVRVLAARVPEDSKMDRTARWFKRYMRPYFVASGTDFQIVQATAPGGLGRTLINEFRARRLADEAAEMNPNATPLSHSQLVNKALEGRDNVLEANELEGGLIIMGRGALKEYLWALRRAYGEPIDLREEARLEGLGLKVGDKNVRYERDEEIVVRELEREDSAPGAVDPFELVEPESPLTGDDEAMPAMNPSGFVPYLRTPAASPPPPTSPVLDESKPAVLPPRPIPPQPPLLLVPFNYAFGAQRWPSKLVHFFNQRSDVLLGAELSLAVLNNKTRPLEPPRNRDSIGELEGTLDLNFVSEMRLGKHHETKMVEGTPTGSRDLDFAFEAEEPYHFRRSYRTLPSAIEYQRRQYLTEELPSRLKVARELANGTRQPTKAETNNPPKIESELRKERLEKEVRWRQQLEGWAVRRAGSGTAWDEGWGNTFGNESLFRVFSEVTDGDRADLEEKRRVAGQIKQAREAALEALP